MDSKESVRIICPRCGGEPRNHTVVSEHVEDWQEGLGYGQIVYQICKCAGCDQIRFRHFSLDMNGDLDPYDIRVYPEAPKRKAPPFDDASLPSKVQHIYRESVMVFGVGANILAGGGLRAIVEAICQEQEVKGRNLEEKIDVID
jgi:hypothetical protein